jgi:hypothetical protein
MAGKDKVWTRRYAAIVISEKEAAQMDRLRWRTEEPLEGTYFCSYSDGTLMANGWP